MTDVQSPSATAALAFAMPPPRWQRRPSVYDSAAVPESIQGYVPSLSAATGGDPASGDSVDAQRLLIEATPGATMGSRLHNAVMCGNVKVVRFLISLGADVNWRAVYGESCLAAAAISCEPECMKELLLAGANPDCRDSFNFTALHRAVSQNSPECVALLLQHNADLEVREDIYGRTARALAESLGYEGLCIMFDTAVLYRAHRT